MQIKKILPPLFLCSSLMYSSGFASSNASFGGNQNTTTNQMAKTVEELVIKDGKLVMIRDGYKDYFFQLDKISFIRKDVSKATPKFTIALVDGEKIDLYKKENYAKIMTIFLNMKKPLVDTTKNSNPTTIPNQEYIKKAPNVNIEAEEKKEIEKMNITNTEKIIALDPMDIKESK